MTSYTDIGRKACTIENLRTQIAELWERTLHVVTSINTALPDGDGHVVLTLADFPEVSIIQGDVDALEEALQTLAQAHSELKSYVTSIGQDLAHLEGDVAALETTSASLAQSVAGLSVDTAALAADAQLTVRELSTEGSATAVKVKGVRKNSTATPGVSLPVASASSAGVLNVADYTGLKGLIPRVEALEYGVQPEPVPVGTWSLEEEGLIKGSELDGQLYPEADGTGSVVGWDNVTDGIDALEAATEGLVADVDDLTDNLAGLASDVEDLEGSVDTVVADVDDLTDNLEGLASDVEDLEGSVDTVVADLGAKQNKLTFDDGPVAGSDNPVKSGGIYDALTALFDRLIGPAVDCAALPKMYLNDISVRVAPVINVEGCTSLKEMFSGCTSLKVANVVNTSSVTTMQSMFYNCSSLRSVPEMDTSKVTDMSYLFFGCSSLTNVPEMDTSSVKNMENMFNNCSSLTSVPPLDTSSVMNMKDMFFRCSSLTSVPPLDTSSVTTMRGMFNSCSLLTSVPPLDTSNVSSMESMFKSCSSLTSVTFTGDVVPPYGVEMFGYTPIASGNGTIYVPDNMVSSYKAASGWSAHASIIKGISEKP